MPDQRTNKVASLRSRVNRTRLIGANTRNPIQRRDAQRQINALHRNLAASSRPPLKVPTRSATRAIPNIRANLVIPALPGLSQALRFLTKRDVSGTAPGFGARLSGQIASNVSGLRQPRAPRPRPAARRQTAR